MFYFGRASGKKPVESARYCKPMLVVARRYSKKVWPDACLKKLAIQIQISHILNICILEHCT